MKKLLLYIGLAIFFVCCEAEYQYKYEFFVQRGGTDMLIEDSNGDVVGYSYTTDGNQYKSMKSATLTVFTSRVGSTTRNETHIVVGQYYYTKSGKLYKIEED